MFDVGLSDSLRSDACLIYLLQFAGRAKWDSWKAIGKDYDGREADAEQEYIDFVKSLGWSADDPLSESDEVRQPKPTQSRGMVSVSKMQATDDVGSSERYA